MGKEVGEGGKIERGGDASLLDERDTRALYYYFLGLSFGISMGYGEW